MKIKYFREGSQDLLDAMPSEYPKRKQTNVQIGPISYTKKGRSYAPLSPIDRSLSALAAVALSLFILPLAFRCGRKYIKQLGKEVLFAREKTIYYVSPLPVENHQFMISTMKRNFEHIEKVASATCFVKITKGGQSSIRQYIFPNDPLINKIDISGCIDKIQENLTREYVDCEKWVIIANLSNGKFHVADNRGFSSNREGVFDSLKTLREMGSKDLKYMDANQNFIRGPYFHDLTTST